MSEENKVANYWTRYFKTDHSKLRYNFPGSENIEQNYLENVIVNIFHIHI